MPGIYASYSSEAEGQSQLDPNPQIIWRGEAEFDLRGSSFAPITNMVQNCFDIIFEFPEWIRCYDPPSPVQNNSRII
jgi:hypothetical protein